MKIKNKTDYLLEIFDYIEENNILYFDILIDMCIKSEKYEWFEVIVESRENCEIVNEYIESRERHIKNKYRN